MYRLALNACCKEISEPRTTRSETPTIYINLKNHRNMRPRRSKSRKYTRGKAGHRGPGCDSHNYPPRHQISQSIGKIHGKRIKTPSETIHTKCKAPSAIGHIPQAQRAIAFHLLIPNVFGFFDKDDYPAAPLDRSRAGTMLMSVRREAMDGSEEEGFVMPRRGTS